MALRRLLSGGAGSPRQLLQRLEHRDGVPAEVVLDGQELHVDTLGRLCDLLRSDSGRGVRSLRLPRCGIGCDGAALVAEVLATDRLALLDLDGNSIGDDGCAALCAVAIGCTALRTLRLAGNAIFDPHPIAAMLHKNASLTSLALDNNRLGAHDRGVAAICEALRQNTTLTELGLGHNGCGKQAGAALSAALFEANETLVAVRIGGNKGIPQDVQDAIAAALEKNRAQRPPEGARRRAATASPRGGEGPDGAGLEARRQAEQLQYDLDTAERRAAAAEREAAELKDQLSTMRTELAGERALVVDLRTTLGKETAASRKLQEDHQAATAALMAKLAARSEREAELRQSLDAERRKQGPQQLVQQFTAQQARLKALEQELAQLRGGTHVPIADGDLPPHSALPSEEVLLSKNPGEPMGLVLDDTMGETAMVLMRVAPDSVAERAGLVRMVGQRLSHIDGQAVSHPQEVAGRTAGASEVLLRWQRVPAGLGELLSASREEARCLRNQVVDLRAQLAAAATETSPELPRRVSSSSLDARGGRRVVTRRVTRKKRPDPTSPESHPAVDGAQLSAADPEEREQGDSAPPTQEPELERLRAAVAAAEAEQERSAQRIAALEAEAAARRSPPPSPQPASGEELRAARREAAAARDLLVQTEKRAQRWAHEAEAERERVQRVEGELREARAALAHTEAELSGLQEQLHAAQLASAADAEAKAQLLEAEQQRQRLAEAAARSKRDMESAVLARDAARERIALLERQLQQSEKEKRDVEKELHSVISVEARVTEELTAVRGQLGDERAACRALTSEVERLRAAEERYAAQVAEMGEARKRCDEEMAELQQKLQVLSAQVAEHEAQVRATRATELALRRAEEEQAAHERAAAGAESSPGRSPGHAPSRGGESVGEVEWVDSKGVKCCHRCSGRFTMTNRKHHCRRCGEVFCGRCCPVSKLADKRLCIDCNAG